MTNPLIQHSKNYIVPSTARTYIRTHVAKEMLVLRIIKKELQIKSNTHRFNVAVKKSHRMKDLDCIEHL